MTPTESEPSIGTLLVAGAALVMLSATVFAGQDPIVFPAKGQINQQIESDKFGCYPPCQASI